MRAQTTLDFAIGVSIFLIVVVYVLSFVPGLFAPFDRAQEAETVAADRVASNLVQGQLATPAEPYQLHRDCTLAFFDPDPDNTNDDGSYSLGNDCLFEDIDLNPRVAIDDTRNINVSMEAELPGEDLDGSPDDEVELLCFDANSDRIVESGPNDQGECDIVDGDDDFLLATGPQLPGDSRGVATARRIVRFRNQTVTVVVRMW
ncbi:DUF7287 family protein [Halorarius halobius]|uniref:DUF7287 family protein n=1 Tax=Halorarius halobius TaxID=2962671 RepID=UPI0020CF0FC0|nr:hypothetical protein [Halorarius halobius]